MCYNFSVSFRAEYVALCDQISFELCIIFNNPIVHYCNLIGTVHMRVSINIIRNSMRCPARMSYPDLSFEINR